MPRALDSSSTSSPRSPYMPTAEPETNTAGGRCQRGERTGEQVAHGDAARAEGLQAFGGPPGGDRGAGEVDGGIDPFQAVTCEPGYVDPPAVQIEPDLARSGRAADDRVHLVTALAQCPDDGAADEPAGPVNAILTSGPSAWRPRRPPPGGGKTSSEISFECVRCPSWPAPSTMRLTAWGTASPSHSEPRRCRSRVSLPQATTTGTPIHAGSKGGGSRRMAASSVSSAAVPQQFEACGRGYPFVAPIADHPAQKLLG